MDIEFKKEIFPKPSEQLIQETEKYWRLKLPSSYYRFLMKYNGGIPAKQTFYYQNHGYCVVCFLCLLEDVENDNNGCFDIDVVLTQIEDRLTTTEEYRGYELLPIAELFGCDYLCLDFRENPNEPCICIWKHDESGELDPVTFKVADSFDDFLAMLVQG